MGDLISRSALLEKRCKITGIVDEAGIKHGAIAIPVEIIKRAPAIDAVPVVRCKDCVKYIPEEMYCNFWCEYRHPEHYCAEGDRREDDGTD